MSFTFAQMQQHPQAVMASKTCQHLLDIAAIRVLTFLYRKHAAAAKLRPAHLGASDALGLSSEIAPV